MPIIRHGYFVQTFVQYCVQKLVQSFAQKSVPRFEPDYPSTSLTSTTQNCGFVNTILMSISDPSTLASKRVVYLGGLPDKATPPLVRAAMIPFGKIQGVDFPMDYVAGKHRGFCFVEYDDADDAEEAIFNMDGAELMGRTIRASLAQPNQANKLSSASGGFSSANQAIWKSDEWFQKHVTGGVGEQARLEQEIKEQDAKILQQEP